MTAIDIDDTENADWLHPELSRFLIKKGDKHVGTLDLSKETIKTDDERLKEIFYLLMDEGDDGEEITTGPQLAAALEMQGYKAEALQEKVEDCDEEKKLTHKEVKYEDPAKGKDRCNGCERFNASTDDERSYSCQVVQSPVTPKGWCEEFKAKAKQVGDEPALEYEDMDFQGLKLNIENLRGSVRHGSTFHQKMTVPYGYIQQTEGADGDAVDCFVGPVLNAPYVYVVHTRNGAGAYDEDKCFLGFESARQAHECFLENYDNPYFFESMEKLSMREFKLKLRTLSGKKITA